MKLNEFWVVLHPTPESELIDICFSTTPSTIGNQYRGGLQDERIAGFYIDWVEANHAARQLLKQRDNKQSAPCEICDDDTPATTERDGVKVCANCAKFYDDEIAPYYRGRK